jgi:Fe-S oxidoreductase
MEKLKSVDEVYYCAKCGYCREECPARRFLGFETYSARGKILLLRHTAKKGAYSKDLMENYYACSLCGYCKQVCPVEIDLLKLFVDIRSELVENCLLPSRHGDLLEKIYKYGNAWGLPKSKRSEWMKELKLPLYEPGMDFLYYVGDVGSFDLRGIEVAKALSQVLLKLGISFGVLSDRELCSGSEAFEIGEKGLLEYLATTNVKVFNELKVRNIVCLSPHSYNVFKNVYPVFGGNFNVIHYTQLIKRFIDEGKLKLQRGPQERIAVTYQDPCFLGRWNGEYSAPREIIRAIPNVELVEMGRSRENAFCCGGGGGNLYTGFGGGMFVETQDSPSRIRIREAYETGAEVLLVACPSCLIMFEDALKVEGLESKMLVKDISEIIWKYL